ncbi:MAG: ABC transporter substrate-binding protein [Deltaproteobacteria bacterium]|nr:ABC transporter substrate-binding protein [Deltaproteobacteria bacterium]MBM4297906.1 ABC transporter substrate-binding protein [Deltaproteobacteria bacterium]
MKPRNLWLTLFASVASFLVISAPSWAQTGKLETLRVSFASFGVIYYPHFLAKELGYYRDEGFDIEMIAMPGGLATQALVAGDLHFSTSSGSSLNASLRGIKLKVVYVNLDRPLYKLMSWRDDIRKVTDLKGKGIGVASRGDTMEGAANLLLRKYGMDPLRDVQWVALGTGGRVTSLAAKTVDSAILGFADTMRMITRGFQVHEVANVGKEIKMLYTGLATSEDMVVKRPDVVKRFIRATVKGREFLKRNKAQALALGKKYDKAPDDVRTADYDATMEMMTAEGMEDLETQKSDIEIAKRMLNMQKDVPAEQIFEFRFTREVYKELREMGWERALKIAK